MPILTLTTLESLTNWVQQQRKSGQTIGVVPTMGALHAGHLRLVKASLDAADQTVVTIFVNPTQFGPNEDFQAYPRTLDGDIDQLRPLGSLVVFAPAANEMYPVDCTTRVTPPAIAKKLEGEFRPTHFEGVTTIVLKLLNLTQADLAFFGQKDYQQAAVIRQMVKDLNVPTEIRVCPIERADDGLALSSRNAYLSPEQRTIALTLHQTLDAIASQIQDGQRDGFEVITEMRQRLIDGGVDSIDYAVVAHPDTLQMVDPIVLPVVALIAVHVGSTRLIDNRVIL